MTALRLVPDEPYDFDAAVARLQPRLQRFAARRLGDLHEAEELVQEALLRACSQQLATEDELAAWCHVVTGRLVLDRLRVRGRAVPVAEVPEGTARHRDTAEVVVARDEARTALDALDAIAPRQAAVLWAREVEGAGYAELCARFAMTEPAVRSLLTRARKALRQEYAARGGTLPHAGVLLLAPWAGVRRLGALHRVATGGLARVAAPLALAVGATALGGLLLSPAHAPVTSLLPASPAARAQPAVVPGARPEPAALPAGGPTKTVALPHPVRGAAAAALAGPARRRTALAPLAGHCTGGPRGGAGAGGSDCAPAVTGYLYVRVPVQAGPLGVNQLGLETNDYNCSHFVRNPLLACRNGAAR